MVLQEAQHKNKKHRDVGTNSASESNVLLLTPPKYTAGGAVCGLKGVVK